MAQSMFGTQDNLSITGSKLWKMQFVACARKIEETFYGILASLKMNKLGREEEIKVFVDMKIPASYGK